MPEYFKHSGCLHPFEELKHEDIPNGSAAFEKVSFLDWIQILVFVGLIDVCNFQTESREYLDDYELFDAYGNPGDGSIDDQELTEFIASSGSAVQPCIALSWNGRTG